MATTVAGRSYAGKKLKLNLKLKQWSGIKRMERMYHQQQTNSV